RWHGERIGGGPERSLSGPRGILRTCAVADRRQARFGDRLCGGPDQLHPLSRLALRPRYFDVRRDRAILAGLDMDLARARHFLCRAVYGGLCAGTLFCGSARSSESGLGDVGVFRLRLSVRLRGPIDRGSACCRHRGPHALRAATVLCEPAICCCRRPDRASARDRCISIYFRLERQGDSRIATNDAHGLAYSNTPRHGGAASLAPRGRAPSAFAVLRSMTSSNLLD